MPMTYEGHKPEDGTLVGWVVASELPQHVIERSEKPVETFDKNTVWGVYWAAKNDKGTWFDVKICVEGRAQNKANYNLTWSTDVRRFSGTPGGDITFDEYYDVCQQEERAGPFMQTEVAKLWKHRPWLMHAAAALLNSFSNADGRSLPGFRLNVTNNAPWAYFANGASKKGVNQLLPDLILQMLRIPEWGVLLSKVGEEHRVLLAHTGITEDSDESVVSLIQSYYNGGMTPLDKAIRELIRVYVDDITTGQGESEGRSASMKTAESGPKSDLDEYFN